MYITVVGAGYVGLATAIGLASLGHHVRCVDNDQTKIQKLLDGLSPYYERAIQLKLAELTAEKLLCFDKRYRHTDSIFFLTVGTPTLRHGESELSYLFSAIDSIIAFASNRSVLVIKSTVPVGTNKKIADYLQRKSVHHDLVSNPEFLREGNAIEDFLNPDRIVIGTYSTYGREVLLNVYQPLIDKKIDIVLTDPNTAELIKQASNAFLANKIALLNELSDFCAEAGADIEMLSLGIGLDKRIGAAFLKVGPGFGGSCLPKDIQSLQHSFQQYNVQDNILQSIINANTYRFAHIAKKISTILGGIHNKLLCVYGIAFKAHTDDIRESPSLKIINLLVAQRAIIHCYDPQAAYTLWHNKPDSLVRIFSNPYKALYGAEALIIATEWEEFKNIDFDQIKNMLNANIIIDLRNLLDAPLMRKKGFQYYCLGKSI